jgi:hypothetical protein
MRTERITITPQTASVMLASNIDRNRPVRQAIVGKYANDMKYGRWVADNGETIKFNAQGQLIDGQHRLNAIVKANVAVTIWVAYDVADTAFTTIDTGYLRSAGAIMHMGGEIDSNKKAALVRNLIKLRAGDVKFKMVQPSVTEILAFYEKNRPLIDECYHFADRLRRRSPVKLQASIVGSVLALVNTEEMRSFLTQLMTGRDIENETIHLLRDRLLRSDIKGTIPSHVKESLMIKAFVAYKNGVNLKVLKEDSDPRETIRRAVNN